MAVTRKIVVRGEDSNRVSIDNEWNEKVLMNKNVIDRMIYNE